MVLIQLLPAILAQLLINDTQAINLSLQNRLLDESDPLESYRIRRFMECVEGRPFRFRILLNFPLDLSLVAGIMSFMVTYMLS